MPSKFLGGHSAADLMTIATAKGLPTIEAAYREAAANVEGIGRELRAAQVAKDFDKEEAMILEYKVEGDKLTRLKQRFDHAVACAEYVEKVINTRKGV